MSSARPAPPADLILRPADLADPRLRTFLTAHLADMAPLSPPESRHALDLSGLAAPGVQVWIAEQGADLVGTVALAPLADGHAELKSMRSDPSRRGAGIGAALLRHALDRARAEGYMLVSLETGTDPFFAAAHRLYARHGFVPCPPFGSYAEDPHSLFMTLDLSA